MIQLLFCVILWQPPSSPLLEIADAPQPPFRYAQRLGGGTSPKLIATDARGSRWIVKGGHEAKPETFATWFVRSLGFYADRMWFVSKGRIESVPAQERPWFIDANGMFRDAAFELLRPDLRFVGGQGWRWNDPGLGRRQDFRALKVVVMLLSNWDNKDARNRIFGTNTGILEHGSGKQIYYVVDWGESLGRWGRFYGRKDWSCPDFTGQTPRFVLGKRGEMVLFGYGGQHTSSFKYDILASDVRWLMPLLDRLTDSHLHSALRWAGGTREEADCFTAALRNRIEQLRKVSLIS